MKKRVLYGFYTIVVLSLVLLVTSSMHTGKRHSDVQKNIYDITEKTADMFSEIGKKHEYVKDTITVRSSILMVGNTIVRNKNVTYSDGVKIPVPKLEDELEKSALSFSPVHFDTGKSIVSYSSKLSKDKKYWTIEKTIEESNHKFHTLPYREIPKLQVEVIVYKKSISKPVTVIFNKDASIDKRKECPDGEQYIKVHTPDVLKDSYSIVEHKSSYEVNLHKVDDNKSDVFIANVYCGKEPLK